MWNSELCSVAKLLASKKKALGEQDDSNTNHGVCSYMDKEVHVACFAACRQVTCDCMR